jgi:hypothetical protein
MNIACRRFAAWLIAMTIALTASVAIAADSTGVESGLVPFSEDPDVTYKKKQLFPLWKDKLKASQLRRLPPPYGVMLITNWMDSDWRFKSATVSLGGSNPISLDAAANATMDLNIGTTGIKGDVWVLPFLDVMGGFGRVDVDAQLGLRNIPLDWDAGSGYTYGDAIIPMTFDGTYYSVGFVVAGAYRHFYGAADVSWVKTDLSGDDASLSTSGFWTFTASPKFGYNAGLSQVYIGARYISKNEHYTGNINLPTGNPLAFDVMITTDTWAPNAGIRTIIQNHWEVLMEVAGGVRHQITGGVGYRW